jgi:hypothetical protein
MARVTYSNLLVRADTTKEVTLTSGKEYTQGTIVTSIDGVNFTDSAILSNTEADYAKQEVLVLADTYNASTEAKKGVGCTGVFRRAEVTFATGQAEADVRGILQSKNINLEG